LVPARRIVDRLALRVEELHVGGRGAQEAVPGVDRELPLARVDRVRFETDRFLGHLEAIAGRAVVEGEGELARLGCGRLESGEAGGGGIARLAEVGCTRKDAPRLVLQLHVVL